MVTGRCLEERLEGREGDVISLRSCFIVQAGVLHAKSSARVPLFDCEVVNQAKLAENIDFRPSKVLD